MTSLVGHRRRTCVEGVKKKLGLFCIALFSFLCSLLLCAVDAMVSWGKKYASIEKLEHIFHYKKRVRALKKRERIVLLQKPPRFVKD